MTSSSPSVLDLSDPKSFVDSLVDQGRISELDLARARRVQSETSEDLNLLLPKLGLISEREFTKALSAHLNLAITHPEDFPDVPLENVNLTPSFLKEFLVVPLSETDQGLVVAMANPENQYARKAIQLSVGKPIIPFAGEPTHIETALEQLYFSDCQNSPSKQLLESHDPSDDIERLKGLASEEPVIRLVNGLIANALESRASDIHIEPSERTLRFRFRVDGKLFTVQSSSKQDHLAIVSRIKILAALDIAERRLPQDGRIKMTVRGQSIDMRISTIPSHYGESVVIRLLCHDESQLNFIQLGFTVKTRDRFESLLQQPSGILLATGPTGSGKTTTLYSSIQSLNSPDRKIVTVEDPIEYEFDGISQVQVQPEIGRGFSNVLRAFLRHDPDIIMVGEIRDTDTADIAMHAALTGHLVLSTLHTRDAAGSIVRLMEMGVAPYLIASTVNGIIAQRLVRVLCPHCRIPDQIPKDLQNVIHRLANEHGHTPTLYRPQGCPACNNSGFIGRTVISELLEVKDAIRNLALKQASAREIEDAAKEDGMTSMFEDGMLKTLRGITSLDETLSVTRKD